MKGSYLRELIDSPGYISNFALDNKELNLFTEAITTQWIKKINDVSETAYKEIKKKRISIDNYHLISKKINHATIWSKKSRILNRNFTKKFLNTNFFNKLRNLFGDIIISDEEKLGYGNIYWRLVRPNQSSDIGPYHRDSWFWQLNQSFPKPNYPFTRVKIWISIYTENGKSGLLVEKNSHKRNDILWEGKSKHGIMKPTLIEKKNNFDMELLPTNPGDCIIFNDNLIHGGALNKGSKTRVSAEFTILKRESNVDIL